MTSPIASPPRSFPPSPRARPRPAFSFSSWIAPAALLLALLGVWEAWVRLAGTAAWLLPAPSRIGRTLWEDRGILAENAWVTLVEVVLGFGVALGAGVLLGALIDASPPLRRALYPLIVASQTVPIPAIAPLLLIWFGYGLLPKVLVTALIGFFPLVVTTVDGLGSTDRDVLDLLRSLGAGRWARFRLGKLPWALPAVFSGAKVAISVCVIGAVFGEFVGSSAGLGYLINRSKAQFLTDRVFACLVLLALMGVGLFALVAGLERLCLPWRRAVLERTDGG